MDSGAMFGLKAAMEQSKSVSKLITSASNQTMNSAGNKPNSSESVQSDLDQPPQTTSPLYIWDG